MPHIIDKETGLCTICQRNEVAAIREGRKYRRQNYDVRKLTLDVITDKNERNYRKIVERHYLNNDIAPKTTPREGDIFVSDKIPKLRKGRLVLDELEQEILKENGSNISNSLDDLRPKSRNTWRDTLRRVNLIDAARNMPRSRSQESNRSNTADAFRDYTKSRQSKLRFNDRIDEEKHNSKKTPINTPFKVPSPSPTPTPLPTAPMLPRTPPNTPLPPPPPPPAPPRKFDKSIGTNSPYSIYTGFNSFATSPPLPAQRKVIIDSATQTLNLTDRSMQTTENQSFRNKQPEEKRI